VVVAQRLGRRSGGIELHEDFAVEARQRLAADIADDPPGELRVAI